MAPPPPLPLRTQKSHPYAGSSAALLPQGVFPPGRRDLLPARGGRRLDSRFAPERCLGSTVTRNASAGSSARGGAWIAPVRARGPWGAMNGTANPLLDREEHCLRLGESFEKRPRASFHTIRCKSALCTAPFGCSSRRLPTWNPSSLLSAFPSTENPLPTSAPFSSIPDPPGPRFSPLLPPSSLFPN